MSQATETPTWDPASGVNGDAHSRWWLERQWDEDRSPMGFVMLNPSTANDDEDDATIRRCVGFAQREGLGGIRVANLFALRSSNPADLHSVHEHPPTDSEVVAWAMLGKTCEVLVGAWGAPGQAWLMRAVEARVQTLLAAYIQQGWQLQCLGRTLNGHPRHPLYVRRDQKLEALTQ